LNFVEAGESAVVIHNVEALEGIANLGSAIERIGVDGLAEGRGCGISKGGDGKSYRCEPYRYGYLSQYGSISDI
jgi:hypothetical protein